MIKQMNLNIIVVLVNIFSAIELMNAETGETSNISTTTVRATTAPKECFNPFCLCSFVSFSDEIRCENFDSFGQLSFREDVEFGGYSFSKITLKPNQPLAFNDELDLKGVSLTNSGSSIEFWYLKSFSLDSSSPLQKLKFQYTSNINLQIKIIESKIQFDYDGNPFDCNSSLAENASLSRMFIYGRTVEFVDVQIVNPMCVYIFRNVNFQTFRIKNLSPDSRIEFISDYDNVDENSLSYMLNCRIDNYIVESSSLDIIDPISNVLNYDVFSYTRTITISNAKVKYIRPDTFFYFRANLTTFKLWPSNWNEFLLVNVDSKWMSGLNANMNANLTDPSVFKDPKRFLMYLGYSNDTYDYPEEDFCYFADFPHHRLILPIVNFAYADRCTCTLISILQYSKFYSVNSDFSNSIGNQKCMNSNYNETIRNCDLEARYNKCKSDSIYTNENLHTEDVNQTTNENEHLSTYEFVLETTLIGETETTAESSITDKTETSTSTITTTIQSSPGFDSTNQQSSTTSNDTASNKYRLNNYLYLYQLFYFIVIIFRYFK